MDHNYTHINLYVRFRIGSLRGVVTYSYFNGLVAFHRACHEMFSPQFLAQIFHAF